MILISELFHKLCERNESTEVFSCSYLSSAQISATSFIRNGLNEREISFTSFILRLQKSWTSKVFEVIVKITFPFTFAIFVQVFLYPSTFKSFVKRSNVNPFLKSLIMTCLYLVTFAPPEKVKKKDRLISSGYGHLSGEKIKGGLLGRRQDF